MPTRTPPPVGSGACRLAPGQRIRNPATWVASSTGRPFRTLLIALSISAAFFALSPVSAAAVTYGPLDHPGPPLTVDPALLAQSVQCHGNLHDPTHEPVLLTPATSVNSQQDFGYNLEIALSAAGFAWCSSDMTDPVLNSNMADIQIRAQYVTYAIRQVYAMAGQKIAVMGHSQGGMIMREALRFWPDTRSMVDDVIGIAGTNEGSTAINTQCDGGCSAAFLQQESGSNFEAALNSGQQTFPGISYTEISSTLDEVVTPNGVNGVSSVHGPGSITNVDVQQICPADHSEHLQLAADPVTWAIADDALTHPGPADLARISSSVCTELYDPGTNAADMANSLAQANALAKVVATYPHVPAEPALECWAFATCTGAMAPTLKVINHHTLVHGRRYARVAFLVTTLEGNAYVPVPDVTVSVAGHSVVTGTDGTGVVVIKRPLSNHARVVASDRGCNSGTETLRFR